MFKVTPTAVLVSFRRRMQKLSFMKGLEMLKLVSAGGEPATTTRILRLAPTDPHRETLPPARRDGVAAATAAPPPFLAPANLLGLPAAFRRLALSASRHCRGYSSRTKRWGTRNLWKFVPPSSK